MVLYHVLIDMEDHISYTNPIGYLKTNKNMINIRIESKVTMFNTSNTITKFLNIRVLQIKQCLKHVIKFPKNTDDKK